MCLRKIEVFYPLDKVFHRPALALRFGFRKKVISASIWSFYGRLFRLKQSFHRARDVLFRFLAVFVIYVYGLPE